MTERQRFALVKFEEQMRENAIAISNLSVNMQEINQFAARNALKGIIQYLSEKLSEIPETTTIGELAAKGEIPS